MKSWILGGTLNFQIQVQELIWDQGSKLVQFNKDWYADFAEQTPELWFQIRVSGREDRI